MLPEEPICQEHTSSVSGILIGTEGEVSIEVEQGFNTATSYTVTSKRGGPLFLIHISNCILIGASTIGVSSTLSVSMGIPAVADVSAELTVNTEITDEVSSTYATHNLFPVNSLIRSLQFRGLLQRYQQGLADYHCC